MQDNDLETWAVIPDPSPQEAGPDYVALVIEWEDPLDQQVTQVAEKPPVVAENPLRKLVVAFGALSALFAARWGIRKLRHAL